MATVVDEGPALRSTPGPEGAGKRRVLVVDDNHDLAVSSSWLLKLQGHEVEVAFDGFRALEVARAFRPDVAILDVGLPGLSGYEVARRLRAEFGRDILLIIITAYARDDHGGGADGVDFDHFFTKPADWTAVIGLLAWPPMINTESNRDPLPYLHLRSYDRGGSIPGGTITMDLDHIIDRFAGPTKPEPEPAKPSGDGRTRTFLLIGKDAELLKEVHRALASHGLTGRRQDR